MLYCVQEQPYLALRRLDISFTLFVLTQPRYEMSWRFPSLRLIFRLCLRYSLYSGASKSITVSSTLYWRESDEFESLMPSAASAGCVSTESTMFPIVRNDQALYCISVRVSELNTGEKQFIHLTVSPLFALPSQPT